MRMSAATLILLFVFAFVVVLLDRGYPLGSAIGGAGAAGVVAAEVARRLLGGADEPPGGQFAIGGR